MKRAHSLAIQKFRESSLPVEVRRRLARLDSFTKLNPRPVIEVDFKGKVVDLNTSAELLFPDLKKKGARHPYLTNFKTIIETLKNQKQPFRRDIKIKERWYKQVFYYIPRFNLIHIYGSDATERKEAEERLKEKEKRYYMLFNKMNEGYALFKVIFNKNKKPISYQFLDINMAFEDIIGLKRKDIIGKRLKKVLPDMNEEWMSYLGKVAMSGKPAHFEKYFKHFDRYYEIFAHQPEEGQLAVMFMDETYRKKIDQERDNFISIMSHELRNPLTPIVASIDLLNAQLNGDSNSPSSQSKTKEYLQIIERQTKQLATLLNDLLDTSKLSRQQISLTKEVVDVSTIATHAIETVRPLIKKQQQKLLISLPKKPLYMKADPIRLEQIIVNILNNASKYTKAHGRIALKIKSTSNVIEIIVKDNGIGINPKKIKKIFKLFNKSDTIPFIAIGSMGIGMNLTKHLVTMHKGKIIVSSKGENKGATFTVRFPKELKDYVPIIKKPQPTPKNTPKKRVLIIDDNKDIGSLLSTLLKNMGHATHVVYTGNDGIKAAKLLRPEVVLVDIGLPDINGYQVAQALKKKYPTMKLIATTGFGQDKDILLAKQSGFTHHLTKPIQIDALLKLL